MQKSPLVYVVVLLYNGKKWMDKCLGSILSSDYQNFRLLVVDNASSDDSYDYVKKNFAGADLMRNSKNRGTAEGNNIGCRYALKKGAEFILLLNQDTYIAKECITELVKLAERDKSLGIIVPAQYDYKKTEELSPTYEKFVDAAEDKDRSIDYVRTEKIIGAGMFLQKRFIEKVGLFDPLYFMYAEENDLVRRGYYHSFKTVFSLKGVIFHWDHLIQSNNPKSRALFDRNQLIEALKDPRHHIIYNLFAYYTKLLREEIRSAGPIEGFKQLLRFIKRQKSCVLLLPRIVSKRNREKRFPCYLSEEYQ